MDELHLMKKHIPNPKRVLLYFVIGAVIWLSIGLASIDNNINASIQMYQMRRVVEMQLKDKWKTVPPRIKKEVGYKTWAAWQLQAACHEVYDIDE